MNSQEKIEIQLLGQKISLRASETDPELLNEIVSLVRTKLKGAEKRTRGGVPHQVLLIALMELAEEYVKAKYRTLSLKREIGDKSDGLLRILEDELQHLSL
jgi:hypothetical protein